MGSSNPNAKWNCTRPIYRFRKHHGFVEWLYKKISKDAAGRTGNGADKIETVQGGRSMKNKHIGSDFDDFLQEENLLAEVEAVAAKRFIAFQLQQEMTARKLTKASLARKMKTSRAALDRLLDPENPSVTLLTLESAASALGRKLAIRLA